MKSSPSWALSVLISVQVVHSITNAFLILSQILISPNVALITRNLRALSATGMKRLSCAVQETINAPPVLLTVSINRAMVVIKRLVSRLNLIPLSAPVVLPSSWEKTEFRFSAERYVTLTLPRKTSMTL